MREKSGFQSRPQEPPRLLIADADPAVRGAIKPVLLQHLQAWIYEAKSGEELAAMLDETDVDLVITNASLPGVTGLEVLDQCRARSFRTPFVVLTSVSERWFEAFVNQADGTVERKCTVNLESLALLVGRLIGRKPVPTQGGSWEALAG